MFNVLKAARFAPGLRRCFSSATVPELKHLSVSTLQSALEQSNIDYRHCSEKHDLAQLVHANFANLSLQVRNELTAIIPAPSNELMRLHAEEALQARVSRLYMDEQYSVQLFQSARPSVTHITSQRSGALSPLQMNPEEIPHGTGSGMVWNADGHIVTNFHVVQNATSLKVTLSNQKSYSAEPVGFDPNNDIAVLKISSSSRLPAIALGKSHDLLVGQKVFAIGNPFGLDQTLTGGIVSGLGRQIQGVTRRIIRDVIQTDASINPGNSGGPLLDSQGRLIGINTMIYSPSGASAGIGFAVPVNTVRRSVNQIIRYGKVQRGVVGLHLLIDQTNQQLRQVLGLPEGVIIQGVVPGSGAAIAGLRGCEQYPDGQAKIGDVIVAVGGERVRSGEDVIGIVEQFSVGDQVPITVHRGTTETTVNVAVTAVD